MQLFVQKIEREAMLARLGYLDYDDYCGSPRLISREFSKLYFSAKLSISSLDIIYIDMNSAIHLVRPWKRASLLAYIQCKT